MTKPHKLFAHDTSLYRMLANVAFLTKQAATFQSIILDVLRGLLTEASSHIGSLVDAYSASLSERRHP